MTNCLLRRAETWFLGWKWPPKSLRDPKLLLDAEAIPGCRLLDSFPKYISFCPCNYSSLNGHNAHLESLDHFCFEVSFSFSTLVVVTDASAILSQNMQAVSTTHL